MLLFKRNYTKMDGKIIVLIIVMLAAQAKAAVDVGFRIIGGDETTIEMVPYMVSITYHGKHICGGTIVSPKIVISAAHCFFLSVQNPISIKKYYRIHAGITRLTDTSAGVNVSLSAVINHPKFNETSMDFDMAIVRLVHNLPLDEYRMRAIRLPDDDFEMPYGQLAEVTGWGRLEYKGELPDVLQTVNVTVQEHSVCRQSYKKAVTRQMFCAGDIAGKSDACDGDSGGPLVYRPSDVLIGVVSWGKKCGEQDFTGVYANVFEMKDWIRKQILESENTI